MSREPLTWATLIVVATGAAVALRHPISVALGTGVEELPQPLVPAGSTPGPRPTPSVTWAPAAAAAAGLPLPTHAPRDPFKPLLKVDLLPQTGGTPGTGWVGVAGGSAAAVSGSNAAPDDGSTDSTVNGTTSLVPTGSRKPVPTAADKAAATGPGKPGAVAAPSSGSRSPATPTDTRATRGSCQVVHVVMQGESLWRIAQVALHTDDAAAITAGWHKIYDANRGAIGSDPDLLQVGTQLCMPSL